MEIPRLENTGEDSLFNNSYTFEKTGNTREILGYACEEVAGDNPDCRYLIYISQETDVCFGSLYKMNQSPIIPVLDRSETDFNRSKKFNS